MNEKVETLRNVYAAIAEAIQALRDKERLKSKADRLERTVKSQEQKITELRLIITGLERITGKKVIVCPECLGAGAYLIGGDVEECDKCDTLGVIEQTKK